MPLIIESLTGDVIDAVLVHETRRVVDPSHFAPEPRIAILDVRVVVSATAVLWSSFMARTVKCIKLGREAEGLDFPTYPGELGKRIFDNVSKEAWKQWLEHQKMLVNENRLNLADKKARDYLVQQMEKYFFGSGADVAAGYIPPSQK
jgi:Fe-S cluster biosynthesis and repair protein YggX